MVLLRPPFLYPTRATYLVAEVEAKAHADHDEETETDD